MRLLLFLPWAHQQLANLKWKKKSKTITKKKHSYLISLVQKFWQDLWCSLKMTEGWNHSKRLWPNDQDRHKTTGLSTSISEIEIAALAQKVITYSCWIIWVRRCFGIRDLVFSPRAGARKLSCANRREFKSLRCGKKNVSLREQMHRRVVLLFRPSLSCVAWALPHFFPRYSFVSASLHWLQCCEKYICQRTDRIFSNGYVLLFSLLDRGEEIKRRDFPRHGQNATQGYFFVKELLQLLSKAPPEKI